MAPRSATHHPFPDGRPDNYQGKMPWTPGTSRFVAVGRTWCLVTGASVESPHQPVRGTPWYCRQGLASPSFPAVHCLSNPAWTTPRVRPPTCPDIETCPLLHAPPPGLGRASAPEQNAWNPEMAQCCPEPEWNGRFCQFILRTLGEAGRWMLSGHGVGGGPPPVDPQIGDGGGAGGRSACAEWGVATLTGFQVPVVRLKLIRKTAILSN